MEALINMLVAHELVKMELANLKRSGLVDSKFYTATEESDKREYYTYPVSSLIRTCDNDLEKLLKRSYSNKTFRTMLTPQQLLEVNVNVNELIALDPSVASETLTYNELIVRRNMIDLHKAYAVSETFKELFGA